ncbi:MAG: hypothetical protein ACK5XN_33820 [Bacteroidota bacterium]
MKVLILKIEFCRGHINEIMDAEVFGCGDMPFAQWANEYAQEHRSDIENRPNGCSICVDDWDDYATYLIPETHPAWNLYHDAAQPLDEDTLVELQRLVEFSEA